MKNMVFKTACLLAIIGAASCGTPRSGPHKFGPPREERYPASSTARVKVVWGDGKFTLYRDNAPYYVMGATTWGPHVTDIVTRGGNSMRTYEAYDEEVSLAETNGISITLGLETRGIDYNDPAAVAAQLAALREQVRRYRSSPSLLCWAIGNEMETVYPGNDHIWDAINDIAEMVHEENPDHPTLTVISGPTAELINTVAVRAPALDILGINAYGTAPDVPAIVRRSVWNGPYIICEWGPHGWWDYPLTAYTSYLTPIEPPGAAKVDIHINHFRAITAETELCLGCYVFLWYQKYECTPTWYTNFLKEDALLGFNGESTETADAVQYCWTGSWPANRAPLVRSITVNGRTADTSLTVATGAPCTGRVVADDLEGDLISYVWEVIPTADAYHIGSLIGRQPPLMTAATTLPQTSFIAPAAAGLYRLCVYVPDGHGHAGVANFPFRAE